VSRQNGCLSRLRRTKDLDKSVILSRRKQRFKLCGRNVTITYDSTFNFPENIEVGDNVYIGHQAFISASGGLRIANNISFGPRVSVHTMNGATSIPYDGVSIRCPVVIKDNIWTDGHAILISGVTACEGNCWYGQCGHQGRFATCDCLGQSS